MSQELISRSPDLQRLRDEGFDLQVIGVYLVVKDVPYVDSTCTVKYGDLITTLELNADRTDRPDTHVIYFTGEKPCDSNGAIIKGLEHSDSTKQLASGLTSQRSFSSKPKEGYPDYYEKVVTYVRMLSHPAAKIDKESTAQHFRVVKIDDEDSVFHYADTASSRAGITAIQDKLAGQKIAIVGLGGTGGYVLDLVAKTPVSEIHLFDGDQFLQHNAFRAPGAATIEAIAEKNDKVDYWARVYSAMRRGIVAHPIYLDSENTDLLEGFDYVFLCIDMNRSKRELIEYLESSQARVIDVGLGLVEVENKIMGQVRTTSDMEMLHKPTSGDMLPPGEEDLYSFNIQIADLNCLNATLAVIKWKKLCGFYCDIEKEKESVYMIDGNHISNRKQ